MAVDFGRETGTSNSDLAGLHGNSKTARYSLLLKLNGIEAAERSGAASDAAVDVTAIFSSDSGFDGSIGVVLAVFDANDVNEKANGLIVNDVADALSRVDSVRPVGSVCDGASVPNTNFGGSWFVTT